MSYRSPKEYCAHLRPIDPIVGDACHLYIGDRRYVVRRFTPQNVGVNTGPDAATTYVCYRFEFRRLAWREVRVNEDFRRALLKVAVPAFRCAYCGNEVAVRDLQNGSDVACCGEVGHVERADER